jgi:hypothetical protein
MPKYKVFIQSNNRQLFGARIAKFALEKHASKPIAVEILNVDELPIFQAFVGTSYLFTTQAERTYQLDDLQSFTLSRFMPPARMEYKGRAVVIDPDIFAQVDIRGLLEKEMGEHAILACTKKNAWDSSVMLLDCAKLRHWKLDDILKRLVSHEVDYSTIMTLCNEDVGELSREWNSLDKLSENTKMLHTTARLTQPWKTGLPVDFTRNKMPKFFGIIPREPIHKLLGRYPTRYQPHPDKNIERFFFDLVQNARSAGVISKKEIQSEIASGNIRNDFFTLMT